jgi:predicted cupin superfamily sugar epimerase
MTEMRQSEADALIARLGLKPHPEGGHFRETFRDVGAFEDGGHPSAGRAYSTAIYFLLKKGEASRWHRVDAAEVWHFYLGSPLELKIGKAAHILGTDLAKGQAPQIVVPKGAWQAARSLGDYTLVGCTVAPGFEFSGFEMAADNFQP